MSIPVRHSGRIAFAALIVIALMAALVGLRLSASAEAPPATLDTATQPTFAIGPIEGLTSSWYMAPPVTSIPLGTIAYFHQACSPDAAVIWTGAQEVDRDAQGSTAMSLLLQPGAHTVSVRLPAHRGAAEITSQCRLNVQDISVDQIIVSPIEAWVDPVEIDEGLPQDELNEVTMDYFFGLSIAALHDLGNGQYLTSVDRLIHMAVEVDPPGFAPLMEWRIDGHAREIGASTTTWFTDIGNHVAEVGPLLNPAEIDIETYSVAITSHTSGEDIIFEGEPVVFIAETDPPGYENEITWLSSTMYGSAEPIRGEGLIFIAEFNDTWGIDENGNPFQWLGVKADNAAFNQDQKAELDLAITAIEVCPLNAAEFSVGASMDLVPAPSNNLTAVELLIRVIGPDSTEDDKHTIEILKPTTDPCGACDDDTPRCDASCKLWGYSYKGKVTKLEPSCFEVTLGNQQVCRCGYAAIKTRKKKKPKHNGPGTYFVEVTIDPDDLIKETDETNNTLVFELLEGAPLCGIGACCLPDGTCIDSVTEFGCSGVEDPGVLGGTYQGDGSTCAAVECPVVGACLLYPGEDLCFISTAEECASFGGEYLGDGINCP